MTSALFDVEPVIPAPVGKLSPDRRRTQRQAEHLARGLHPLTAALRYPIKLHAAAAPADDRDAEGRRCGDCRYRRPVGGGHDGRYPKCVEGYQERDPAKKYAGPPRVTNGAGTDVRAWWPGCVDHEYGEPKLSDDAARWVPEVAR